MGRDAYPRETGAGRLAEKEARAAMGDHTHVRDGAVVLAQVYAASNRLDEALREIDGVSRDGSPVENRMARAGQWPASCRSHPRLSHGPP